MGKAVKVISYYDLASKEGWLDLEFDESGKVLNEWCEKNDATFYSEPKEDFFIFKGINKAEKEGKSIVVVENMS